MDFLGCKLVGLHVSVPDVGKTKIEVSGENEGEKERCREKEREKMEKDAKVWREVRRETSC